ncbi:MAG: hypothetical protein L0H79_17195 [Intrasporangium sp.]|uniref:hypothetical protein n=1 Tax=Intrasporangium sp. TaxID=1925024 RepID=UPI002647C565|nr:hypothetical protein [Intrasporangium sp.]MDN5797468.1 hypothetical protein [Intrasporangium sp.]
MQLTITTMVACFENEPAPDDLINNVLHGRWFLPDPDTPACGEVLHVKPDQTNDGTERMFVCDRPAQHSGRKHRQVVDAAEGEILEWGTPSP